jgi:hypothetical protein
MILNHFFSIELSNNTKSNIYFIQSLITKAVNPFNKVLDCCILQTIMQFITKPKKWDERLINTWIFSSVLILILSNSIRITQ